MSGGRNSKMAVKPLYTISLQKVFSLLEGGTWSSCRENPFSFFPTKVVEDLTTLAYYDSRSAENIVLLFTSGRISHLNLIMLRMDVLKELDAILKMLSEDVCRNIRKFSFSEYIASDHITLLEDVLRRCPNLESVYSKIRFDLNALANCKEMRCVRFHMETEKESYDFTSHTDFGILRSFNNLKTFAFCNGCVGCFIDYEALTDILLNSPKLISVGYVDSLQVFTNILSKEIDHPPHFELRRCLWGHSKWDIRNLRYLDQYKRDYPQYIQNAVSLSPLVEVLALLVFHKECLQHLSHLRHLTFLILNFYHYRSDDYISDLISLLQKIGPQLKHFSIEAKETFSFDLVGDLCPNLESLHLDNSSSVVENPEPSLCLKRLKRLSIGKIDKETLMYLLLNCRDLEELYLFRGEYMEDGLLASILKKNPLAKLKVALIFSCGLSKEGLRLLLLGVPSLEKVHTSHNIEVKDVVNELNLEPELSSYVSDFFYEAKLSCRF